MKNIVRKRSTHVDTKSSARGNIRRDFLASMHCSWFYRKTISQRIITQTTNRSLKLIGNFRTQNRPLISIARALICCDHIQNRPRTNFLSFRILNHYSPQSTGTVWIKSGTHLTMVVLRSVFQQLLHMEYWIYWITVLISNNRSKLLHRPKGRKYENGQSSPIMNDSRSFMHVITWKSYYPPI